MAKHVDHVDKEIAFQQINARMRALESDRQTRNQRNARNGTNYIPFFLQSQIDACRGMMKDLQEAEELFRVGCISAFRHTAWRSWRTSPRSLSVPAGSIWSV